MIGFFIWVLVGTASIDVLTLCFALAVLPAISDAYRFGAINIGNESTDTLCPAEYTRRAGPVAPNLLS